VKLKPLVTQNLSNPAAWRTLALASLWMAAPLALGYEIQEHRTITPKKPVSISSQQMNFDRLKSLTVFKGLVKAIHDKVTLNSDEMRALSDNRNATALGHVVVVDSSNGMTLTCGNLDYQDLMDLMTAHDHPQLTAPDEKGLPMTILGKQMVFDSVEKTIQINQNVSITQADAKATAQKATYISTEDKFILEDDPKVEMKNGDISGRRIVSNFGEERSIISEGMAEANFYPQGKTGSAAPVSGTAPGNGTTPVNGTAPGNGAASGNPSGSAAPAGAGVSNSAPATLNPYRYGIPPQIPIR
jgi:lipopolysaccharide export system protein LptA